MIVKVTPQFGHHFRVIQYSPRGLIYTTRGQILCLKYRHHLQLSHFKIYYDMFIIQATGLGNVRILGICHLQVLDSLLLFAKYMPREMIWKLIVLIERKQKQIYNEAKETRFKASHMYKNRTPTEGKGSVRLNSSLWYLVLKESKSCFHHQKELI